MHCGDAAVEKKVEDKISQLYTWVEKNPGKKAQVRARASGPPLSACVSLCLQSAEPATGHVQLAATPWIVHTPLLQQGSISMPCMACIVAHTLPQTG